MAPNSTQKPESQLSHYLHLAGGNLSVVAIAAGVVVVLIFALRLVVGKGRQKDPQRVFTTAQRMRGFQRAGNRCEHKPLIGWRCRTPASQGDHIYPWSRGGATSMSNFQGMCAMHNNRKSDHVPGILYIWRLERRRRKYFPPHEYAEVIWKIGVRP